MSKRKLKGLPENNTPLVDFNEAAARLCVIAFFVDARAVPAQRNIDFLCGDVDELPHRMLLAGRDHEVLGLVLLQHAPLHLDVIACMAPIAQRVEISEVELVL